MSETGHENFKDFEKLETELRTSENVLIWASVLIIGIEWDAMVVWGTALFDTGGVKWNWSTGVGFGFWMMFSEQFSVL